LTFSEGGKRPQVSRKVKEEKVVDFEGTGRCPRIRKTNYETSVPTPVETRQKKAVVTNLWLTGGEETDQKFTH